jgi:hypothetical protein
VRGHLYFKCFVGNFECVGKVSSQVYMVRALWLIFLAGLLAGCATSTIESRKRERVLAYDSLPPQTRSLVDRGAVAVGMTMDAVYIAWGQPSQILNGQSDQGSLTTWLYHGTQWEEHRYWNYRTVRIGRHYYTEPMLDYDYYPRDYVRGEVVFENGLVKSWRTLAQPP